MLAQILLKSSYQNQGLLVRTITCQVFSLTLTVRGVSNKHCLLTFFIVSCKRKFVHIVLVNCVVKLAEEKVWLGELTVPTCMTIAFDWDVKNQTKQTKLFTLCIKRLFVKKSCKFCDRKTQFSNRFC